jgi:hypothetical protein
MDAHVDDGRLNALLDGELAPDEVRAVEGHLAGCAECRRRLEEARRFLQEAGELLEVLDTPAPVAVPRQSVARTAKERAVAVGRTQEEPAITIEPAGAEPKTQQSPAIRPIFREEAGPRTARPFPWRQLAWAASVVLALGAGLFSGPRLFRAPPTSDVAAAPATSPEATTRAAEPAAAAPAAPGRSRTGSATPLVKPRAVRGQKATDEVALRELPPPTQRTAARVADSGRQAGADEAQNVAGVTRGQPAAAPLAGAGAAAAPVPARAEELAAAPSAAAPAPSAADAGTRVAVARTATTFRRITMDQAVRALSGSIRLVDGLMPVRVESGPGRLVSGAAPEREVVRVHYVGSQGESIWLDQQPGEGPPGGSTNGLMPGDTLVTFAPSGAYQVRWLDRKGFWLSLTGTGNADSLRALVGRIR